MKIRAWSVPLLMLCAAAAVAQTKQEYFADRNPDLAKLAGPLLQVRRAVVKDGLSLNVVGKKLMPAAVRGDSYQVVIAATTISGDLMTAIRDAGLVVVKVYSEDNIVVALFSSVGQLDALVTRKDIRGIAPEAGYKANIGQVTSQGDGAMNASIARSVFDIDGTGIKVGVMSDSFSNASIAEGDMPEEVEVIENGEGTNEGGGMVEIVHDVAPGAEIAFATAASGYYEFRDNIYKLASADCNVICDDVLWVNEPKFQDGPIAIAADKVVTEQGVAFFSAAGNGADLNHTAPFSDIVGGNEDVFPPAGKDFHNFGGGKTSVGIKIPFGSRVFIVLHWDQPYGGIWAPGPGSAADLDLYLTDKPSAPFEVKNIIAMSGVFQGKISLPFGDSLEFIDYTNDTSNDIFYISIDRAGDPPLAISPSLLSLTIIPRDIDVQILDQGLLGDPTIFGHTAATHVMSMAAIHWKEIQTAGSFQDGAGYDVEPFSALGGNLPFFFDTTGQPFSGSNPYHGAPQNRFKPDLTAPDGVNTSFFPIGSPSENDIPEDPDTFPNFFGTSASAPHAAGAAALMLDYRNGALAPAQLYQILKDTAVDSEEPGVDALSGSGYIDVFAAVGQTIALPTPTPIPGTFNDANILCNSIPDLAPVGQTLNGTITVENNGTTTWTSGNFYLKVISDPCGLIAGGRIDLLPGETILPGQQRIFNVAIAAPVDPTVCVIAFQMFEEGAGLFGQAIGADIEFADSSVVDFNNEAQLLCQECPTTICDGGGSANTITVRLRNIGDTTWTAGGGYKLAIIEGKEWVGDTDFVGFAGPVLPGSVCDPDFANAPDASFCEDDDLLNDRDDVIEAQVGLVIPSREEGDPVPPPFDIVLRMFQETPAGNDILTLADGSTVVGNLFGPEIVCEDITITALDATVLTGVGASLVPANLMPGQISSGLVVFQNDSNVTWNDTDFHVRVQTDSCGMVRSFADASLVVDTVPLPVGSSVAPGQTVQVPFNLQAPGELGTCNIVLQMESDECGPFGEVYAPSIPIVNQPAPIDFTEFTFGWTGGVAAGAASTSTAGGLCMAVPAGGDNIALWVSQEDFLPLRDNTVYRVRVTATTNQTLPNSIPLWDVSYDNFHAGSGGNNFGGQAWFLDVAGGAAGIGRETSEFDVFVAPNAALTAQWRGTATDGTKGAFAPEFDAFNDIRMMVRTLDLGSAGIAANSDSGTICVKSLQVNAYLLSQLQSGSTLYNTPISSETHAPLASGQTPLMADIDNGGNVATYMLSTTSDRATLIPAVDLDPPNKVYTTASLYPVALSAGTIYKITADIQAGTGSGTDPLDALFLNVDTPSNELGMMTFSARGSSGNMHRTASPHRPSSTGNKAQTYVAFFSGQAGTLSGKADDALLRPMVDMFNAPELYGVGTGDDQIQILNLKVETVTLP